MTDLLGLLAGIHGAVNQLGGLRIAMTDLDDGMLWVVDTYTKTIHIRPGLALPDGLAALTAALAVLAPPVEQAPPLAAGGEGDPVAPMPAGRHLRAIGKAP
jgi:hypothetical protein